MVTREAKFAFTWPLGNYIRDLSKFEVAKIWAHLLERTLLDIRYTMDLHVER